MFEMEFKFSKFLSIKSKSLCLDISKSTKWLTAHSKAYALCYRKCKQAFVKENEKKNICVKEMSKILEKYGWTFSPNNHFSLLESCQFYIITKYKASNCFKREEVVQRCSRKQGSLKIWKIHRKIPVPEYLF